MTAYNSAQRNDIDYQTHPIACYLGSLVDGLIGGAVFFWASGWHARRKQRNLELTNSSGLLAPERPSPVIKQSQRRPVLPWFALVAITIAVLLWFNRYSMSQMGIGDGITIPVRTSRLTGDSEMLVYGRWVPVAPSDSAARKSSFDLPNDELRKIQVTGETTRGYDQTGQPGTTLIVTVYNGTSHPINGLVVQINLTQTATQSALTREYTLMPTSGSPAPQLSSADFAGRIDLPEPGKWTWGILRASSTR